MTNVPPLPPPAQPPAGSGYGYAPPQPQYLERPRVWPWFVAYALLMALLYLVAAGFGVTILALGPERFETPRSDADVLRFQGVALAIMGLVLSVPFAIAPFLPRRPGVWVYDLVLICLGVTIVCCLPLTIPLLIFWIKPETKAWFGR